MCTWQERVAVEKIESWSGGGGGGLATTVEMVQCLSWSWENSSLFQNHLLPHNLSLPFGLIVREPLP